MATPSTDTDAAPPPAEAPAKPSTLKRLRIPLMLGGVLIVAVIAGAFWLTGGRYQETDNAYVRVGTVGISSEIAGRVDKVFVRENQRVKAGDVLFTLDSRAGQVAESQAAAQLDNTRLQIAADQAAYRQTLAELKAAQDAAAYRQRDQAREQNLLREGAVSRSEYDAAANAATQATRQIAVARERVEAARAKLGATGAVGHPEVRAAEAVLDTARLRNSYNVVRAPQDGVVTKVEQLQAGDYVNASQPVFNLVVGQVWIEAAFKENQLSHMRPGQTGTVKVDAYPGHVFQARLESIAPGTDQTFSVLPAQNASGNWVKVVQRVPVRLVFTRAPDITLQAGLSARVKLDTNHRRRLGSD